jgi:two-component system, LuxR family, sensor kinase FixL
MPANGEVTALADDALFGVLIETAVDGIVVIDARGLVQVYNAACERLFGYHSDEVVGRNVKMLMPEPYHGEHDAYLSNYRKTGKKQIIGIGREVLGRRKDGSVFPMYLSVGQGTLSGNQLFVGIIRDLTAIKAEAALRGDADRLLAQIVQSSDDAILSKTLDGVITSWNNAAERIFGYRVEEAIGKPVSILIPPERLDEEVRILAQLRAGQDIEHYETVRRHKNGGEILVSLSVSPIRDAAGRVVGASKIARDVTEQKRAQERAQALQAELAHVGRLNAIGQMSAAIAHELNQPLTAITNYVTAAFHTLAPVASGSEPVMRAQDMIEKAAKQTIRAGGIIRNLRDFVEKRESTRAAENLNAIIEEAMAFAFAGGAGRNVKTRLNLDSALPEVLIDKIQIQQVLVNLIRNSIEAMAETPAPELSLSTGADEPGFAQVTVADTGPGLRPDIAARLFQPFVTTKEKGMGIGLRICQSIVDDHGGRIWLLPDTSVGAAFRVRLPLTTQAEPAA